MLNINNIILINDPYTVSNYFEDIGKGVGDTIELNNVVLTFNDIKKPEKELPTEMDTEERNWLMDNTDIATKELYINLYTRRAIMYNLHKSGLGHNCLNTFHFYYREDKLHLNVYVRSMNFDANFENDLYTFNILLEKACNKLSLVKGQIVVFIMSLHRKI